VDEIEDRSRSGADGDVLTVTVLFTVIVASPERQTRVGPREWSRLTDHHHNMVGRRSSTTGP
jgi:class 3 adenylate cyclase